MSDLKLFRITGGTAEELTGSSVCIERQLQRTIESNMEKLFGVRFLASEYSTGAKHRGRIDSSRHRRDGLSGDFEYKRSPVTKNVINQGLFYLDWLLDTEESFQLLVMDRLGMDAAKAARLDQPRLVCVAGDFTRYDEHAVSTETTTTSNSSGTGTLVASCWRLSS